MNHEAIRRRKKNAGGERSATDRHKMSGIVIGETLTTGMTDMIETGIIMDGTRNRTGITPPVTTRKGRITVSMTTSPPKVTDTKRTSTRNVISTKKGATHGNQKRAPQAPNRTRAKDLLQDNNRGQEQKPNPATPGRRTAIIAGKKDTIVTNVRQRATISDQR